MTAHRSAWRSTRSPLHENVLRSLVYAFGIVRNEARLLSTAHDPDLPPSAREAATWWMDRPAVIHKQRAAMIPRPPGGAKVTER